MMDRVCRHRRHREFVRRRGQRACSGRVICSASFAARSISLAMRECEPPSHPFHLYCVWLLRERTPAGYLSWSLNVIGLTRKFFIVYSTA